MESLDFRLDRVNSFFTGRKLAITSMHGKAEIIGPIFNDVIGFEPEPIHAINTDTFGSFSKVNSRKESPEDTVVAKCLSGMNFANLDCGVATEASFFPDPSFPYRTVHEELMIYIDTKLNFQIIESIHSLDTLCRQQQVNSKTELLTYLDKWDFPRQKIHLKWTAFTGQEITKFCESKKNVSEILEKFKGNEVEFEVSTDQRAHYNPSRMQVIRELTLKLAHRLGNCCEKCSFPGFGQSGVVRGLTCSQCGLPSSITKAELHSCVKCNFEHEVPVANVSLDPMYCNFCNP